MASLPPPLAWTASTDFSNPHGVLQAFESRINLMKERREVCLRAGSAAWSEGAYYTRIIVVLEAAIDDLPFALSDAAREALLQLVYHQAGEIMRAKNAEKEAAQDKQQQAPHTGDQQEVVAVPGSTQLQPGSVPAREETQVFDGMHAVEVLSSVNKLYHSAIQETVRKRFVSIKATVLPQAEYEILNQGIAVFAAAYEQAKIKARARPAQDLYRLVTAFVYGSLGMWTTLQAQLTLHGDVDAATLAHLDHAASLLQGHARDPQSLLEDAWKVVVEARKSWDAAVSAAKHGNSRKGLHTIVSNVVTREARFGLGLTIVFRFIGQAFLPPSRPGITSSASIPLEPARTTGANRPRSARSFQPLAARSLPPVHMYSTRGGERIRTPARLSGSNTILPRSLAARTSGRNGAGALRPVVLALARLIPIASAAPLGLLRKSFGILEDDAPPDEDANIWLYLGIAVALVLLGGVFAGLTIALMGQDETYLQVIATSGDGSERKAASRVLSLLNRGKHWVLVTLLLGNVITNETLPIVLDRSLGGGWPAVLSSTVLIVIFGEIAPQSVCVRYGLTIGAYMSPFVVGLMYLMFPIAWPTAKLLDWLLGEDHGTTYKKAGLKTLVQLHKTLGTTPGERLMEDEVTIINSVLDLKEKPVGSIMTPMQDVFTMSADTVLDERMMDTILSQGYSRIPVHAPDNTRNFIGMLLVKILITYDPEDCMRVRDFALATLPETSQYTSCLDIINFFQEGKSHMVLVSDFPGTDKGALGVVTLEDVIEELIGEEIIDESDVFVNVQKAIRRAQPAPKQRFKNLLSDGGVTDSEQQEKVEPGEDVQLLGNGDEGPRPGLPNGQYSQTAATLVTRRKSSVGSDSAKEMGKPVSMRNNTTADLKQHLIHLGPSNAASKPRSTKYTSVKIKPGVGTIPENQPMPNGSESRPMSRLEDVLSPGLDGERTGLLDAAGIVASEGVRAVKANYGTTGSSAIQRRLSSDSTQMSAWEASRQAQENADPPIAPDALPSRSEMLRAPEKLVVGDAGDEDDEIGEMEAPSRDRSKPRRTVRSGSITETTVDAGGMKKVVLETASSSSEEIDEADSSKAVQGSPKLDGQQDERNADESVGTREERRKKDKKGKRKKGKGV